MVAPKKVNYEESRLKRLEENKKIMEELKLTALAQSLRTTSSPKPSPIKKVKRTPRQSLDLSAVRRSNRVADKPPPSYKEEDNHRLRVLEGKDKWQIIIVIMQQHVLKGQQAIC